MLEEKKYFAKLANCLFYGLNNNKSESIIKEIENEKVLLVMDYLYMNTNIKNQSIFCLDDMITKFGLKPRTGQGNANEQIKSILIKLDILKIIKLDDVGFKPKKMYYCEILLNLSSKFFMLYEYEKELILGLNNCEVDNIKVLVFYCYLKARMFNKPSAEKYTDFTELKPSVCYPPYKSINRDINLSESIIKRYIDLLVKLNLIRVGNAGLWHYVGDSKNVYESTNVYTLYADGWEKELGRSIRQYKFAVKGQKVFLGTRIFKNNNKSENGFIGKIIGLEKKGKATAEQLQRKDELIAARDERDEANSIKRTIKVMLENPEYKDMGLADIYRVRGNNKLFEVYSDIEENLDIIDVEYMDDYCEDNSNTVFLVDMAHYQWLMMNYSSDKHDYYHNCAQKYIKDNPVVRAKVKMVGLKKRLMGSDKLAKDSIQIEKTDEQISDIQYMEALKKYEEMDINEEIIEDELEIPESLRVTREMVKEITNYENDIYGF